MNSNNPNQGLPIKTTWSLMAQGKETLPVPSLFGVFKEEKTQIIG
jgi:hypothetical protein